MSVSISLSSSDLHGVARAIRVLTSPFDFGGVDGWRSAVNRCLKTLLDADSAGFLLPVPDGFLFHSDELDPEVLLAFPDYPPPPLIDGSRLEERMLDLGVATVERGYGRHFDRYLKSEYYLEYATPARAHDTLVANFEVGGDGPCTTANLHFWHSRPDGRRFGEREEAILRLVFPAFQAGVRSYLRWSDHCKNLLNVLDELGEAAVIADLDGRIVHATPGFRDLIKHAFDGSLNASIRAAVPDFCRVARAEPVDDLRVLNLTRDVCGGAYRLRGCLYNAPHTSDPAFVVLSIEPAPSAAPSRVELQERFRLTPRQAEIALLLARRKSNREIADELFISPHTVRHHVAAVLSSLGLDSRRLVAEALTENQ